MSLATGVRLGPYEIVGPIGAGGMGEVYRARDTRLDRTVAIKILPSQVASDPEFRERFDREARSIAALNHPHICTLHDVGHDQGADFLVMELVEGETLAERLQQGPLSIHHALTIAQQIAEALEAAHEKGILHRDLKPANIKVTPDGAVKVLDFGLAKALERPGGAGGSGGVGRTGGDVIRNSPTITAPGATAAGIILGTAAYMSPEQARGKAVDRRTDVWAFGCVLYEILTAKPAFGGETITDILGAIVHKEPDWSALPAETPPRLHELLRRCLQKDAKLRLRDMGDAQLDLHAARIIPETSSTTAVMAAPAPSRWRQLLPWAIAATLAVGLAVASMAWWRATSQTEPVRRLNVEILPSGSLSPQWGQGVIISPDGARLAYVAGPDRRLHIRALDQLEGVALTGTDGAVTPFFSPDSQWVGFFAGNTLKKISVTGGAPLMLCSLGQGVGRGGSWGDNDTIVFASDIMSGLLRVPAVGGTPQEVTKRDPQTERSHRWPYFVRGRNAVLFTVQFPSRRWDESNVEVVNLDTLSREVVYQGGTHPQHVATGHLLFVRESTLFAVPFDAERLEVTGAPAPVLEGVGAQSGDVGSGVAEVAVSATGSLAYLTSSLGAAAARGIAWVDRKGTVTPLRDERAGYTWPRISPDGGRVAVFLTDRGSLDIWVYEIAHGTFTPITFGREPDGWPIWTPDSQRITYASGAQQDLYSIRADGSGQVERLTESPAGLQRPGSWSSDGKVLAFSQVGRETNWDLWTLRLDGDRKPQIFLRTPGIEIHPEFSPDGRWLAYGSDESGRLEVYVRPFPDTGGKWRISTDGGMFPRWSRDGRELVYRDDDRVMSVTVTAGPSTLQSGTPRELFRGTFAVGGLNSMYDLAPDGRRFVMVTEPEGANAGPAHVNLIFNWFDDLKARLAAKR